MVYYQYQKGKNIINPCKECIVLAICKGKFIDKDFYGGVIAFSFSVRCVLLTEYLQCADQVMIDNVRDVYGLEPYSREGKVNNDEPM